MQNAFEYAETVGAAEAAAQAGNETVIGEIDTKDRPRSGSVIEQNPHRPYVSLATFRMVVLADEVLESFFEIDLTQSWKLEQQIIEIPVKAGFFGGLASAVGSFIGDEGKVSTRLVFDI